MVYPKIISLDNQLMWFFINQVNLQPAVKYDMEWKCYNDAGMCRQNNNINSAK